MSQNVERARAVKMIVKLMGQTTTRGRTESEMEFAMDQMNKLMTTFNLTLDQVTLATLDYKTVSVEGVATKGDPMQRIVCGIAAFTDCKVWHEKGAGKYVHVAASYYKSSCVRRVAAAPATYKFFGIDSDTQMAVFLYEMITNSLVDATKKFQRSRMYTNLKGVRGAKKSALVSFRKGFIGTLSSRLFSMHAEQIRNVRTASATGTDLILSKSKVREEKFNEQMGIKLRTTKSYSSGPRNMTAFGAGRESANTVNLSRPMPSGNHAGTLMLS